MRRRIWLQSAAVAAVLLGGACAQSLDSLPPCGISCVNTVIAKGFGCASQDNACLCKNPDFAFGVRDCASQSCSADAVPKVNEYVSALCASATRAAPAPTQPASSPPPSSPAPPTTPPAPPPQSTSQQPAPPAITTTSPTPAGPASSSPSNSPTSDSPSKPVSEVAQTTQLTSTAPTTLSTSTKSHSSTSTKATASASQPSQSGSTSGADTNQVATDSEGLSSSAKIGIGVGAGVGVLAIALALYLLIRRPKSRATSMQISGPMPGSGRDYSTGIIGMTGKNFSELEMRSRRYEDMVPRQTPRRMI